ncbi:HAD family hydrolase [Gaetbulibacter aestuarii]|uniref:HAD family phosphatase n=1 Tax=Gaetbulibacter aestuarii TaxID=1502358 RepID=A0ABW7N2P2_9FLAO
MIKALIFDFGNVFLNLDIEGAMRKTLNAFNIESLSNDMIATNERYETGDISSEAFIDFYRNKFPDISEETWIPLWNSMLKDFPEYRLEFLQKLQRSNKFKLILFSNTNEIHLSWVKHNVRFYETFKNCFDAFYLSHEIHRRKPDVSSYEFILSEHQLKGKDCFFVDDNADNIKGAASLGIHTWHINPKHEDVTELFQKHQDLF